MSRNLESPWYCRQCEVWVGYCRDRCLEGHHRPRWPLTYEMAGKKPAYRVGWRDRLRAKVRGLRSIIRGDA